MIPKSDVDRVVPIEERHVSRAADLLSRAMDVDAAYQYLFPDAAVRQRGLADLFARNLSLHRAHRCSYVALNAREQVIGTVTMRPPGGLSISTLTMVRYGLLPFALRPITICAAAREPSGTASALAEGCL